MLIKTVRTLSRKNIYELVVILVVQVLARNRKIKLNEYGGVCQVSNIRFKWKTAETLCQFLVSSLEKYFQKFVPCNEAAMAVSKRK